MIQGNNVIFRGTSKPEKNYGYIKNSEERDLVWARTAFNSLGD